MPIPPAGSLGSAASYERGAPLVIKLFYVQGLSLGRAQTSAVLSLGCVMCSAPPQLCHVCCPTTLPLRGAAHIAAVASHKANPANALKAFDLFQDCKLPFASLPLDAVPQETSATL